VSWRSERRELRLPLMAVPLIVYLGATLVVPAVRGAARQPGFLEHAVLVAGLSGVVAGIAWLAGVFRRSRDARLPLGSRPWRPNVRRRASPSDSPPARA
jgi:hypothetical protein